MRILGVDPGLTRCGVGIVDAEGSRMRLAHVTVLTSPPDMPLEQRLMRIARGVEALIDEYAPQRIALERVFAQSNVTSVMSVAQISGLVLRAAAERSIPIALHTPSEVKAAVTGYGSAEKAQVQTMVQRILRLDAPPKPADAADALALAICHAWRGGAAVSATVGPENDAALTPAQRAWREAERRTRRR